MTTTDVLAPRTVLDAVHDLAPSIAARAAEIEAARRLPSDLLDTLRAAGCFRLLMPPGHGGLGADLGATLGVLEALAAADASTAWTVMVGGSAWVDLAGLPRASFDALFSRPDVIVAGAFAPSGAITPVDGGYHLTGRWAFGSGCEHADVLYGNCVEDGGPGLRIAVLPRSDVVVEDTWTASGLRGTGSHHFHVDGATVPAARTCDPLADDPCLDAPAVHVPVPALLSLMIATVAVGIARAALRDVLDLAGRRVPLLDGAPLAANPLFHFDVADADAALRAATASLHATADEAWATAVRRAAPTPTQRARLRATAVWATTRSVAVVAMSSRSAGSSAVPADAPLNRRLRDVQTLAQHFLVKRDTLTTAGAILAGQDVAVPVF